VCQSLASMLKTHIDGHPKPPESESLWMGSEILDFNKFIRDSDSSPLYLVAIYSITSCSKTFHVSPLLTHRTMFLAWCSSSPTALHPQHPQSPISPNSASLVALAQSGEPSISKGFCKCGVGRSMLKSGLASPRQSTLPS
jgi:hypothetical protein